MARPAAVLIAALVGLAASVLSTPPVLARATTSTENVKLPINELVFVPCAAGGAGEFVLLSGDLHMLFHVTLDGAGGVHLKEHANPQRVSGTGLTTGDRYRGAGATQFQLNGRFSGPAQRFETTTVNNVRIIGQGPNNNLLLHQNLHVTVNANGEVTAFVDNFRVECK